MNIVCITNACITQSNGWTALHYASDAGHDEVVSLLLKATKVIDPKDSVRLLVLFG